MKFKKSCKFCGGDVYSKHDRENLLCKHCKRSRSRYKTRFFIYKIPKRFKPKDFVLRQLEKLSNEYKDSDDYSYIDNDKRFDKLFRVIHHLDCTTIPYTQSTHQLEYHVYYGE